MSFENVESFKKFLLVNPDLPLNTLIRKSNLRWIDCLTQKERMQIVEPLLTIPDCDDILEIFSYFSHLYHVVRFDRLARPSLLPIVANFILVRHPINRLLLLLQKSDDADPRKMLEFKSFLEHLTRLHELAESNTSILSPPSFVGLLVKQIHRALETSSVDSDKPVYLTAHLFTLLIRRGCSDSLASCICSGMLKESEVCRLLRDIFVRISFHEFYQLAIRFLSYDEQDLQSILSNLMADNRLLPVFLERAVMQQDLNLRKLNVIIKFVAQNHAEWAAIPFNSLVEIWYSRRFVQSSDFEFQKCIFGCLAMFCRYIPKESLSESDVAKRLLMATPIFMEYGRGRTRILGLRLAEIVSGAIQPGMRLDFELERDEVVDAILQIIDPSSNVQSEINELSPSLNSLQLDVDLKSNCNTEPLMEDPDEVQVPSMLLEKSKCSESDDSSSEDEETVALFKNRRAAKTSAINTRRKGFIKQHIDALGSKDDVDGIEFALEALPSIVSECSKLEIDEYLDELMSRLLYVENTFELPHFDQYRLSILLPINARCTNASSKISARALFDKNCTVNTKMTVLNSWVDGYLRNIVHEDNALSLSQMQLEIFYFELMKQLRVSRNWSALFERVDLYHVSLQFLHAIFLIACGATISIQKKKVADELSQFIDGFKLLENRYVFEKELQELSNLCSNLMRE